MRKKLMAFIVAAICMAMPTITKANTESVRIGLEKTYKNVASISVNNNDVNVINNGMVYDVDTNGGYVIKPFNSNYYKIGTNFSTYSEAQNKLPLYTGFNCIPALTDDGWTIYVAANKKPEGTVTNIKTGANTVVFSTNGTNKFIADSSKPIQISTDSKIVDLGKYSYRDNIELNVSGTTLTAVNVIDTEHYLYGVVNSEMPYSWELEAQKAQAVAARTYVFANPGKHGSYDLCDGTECQEYCGTANESEIGRQAVDSTKGVAVYYENKPIYAVYFSSDGGATQNCEDVWVSELPYLRGIVDEYEKECKEWTKTYTYTELTNICNSKGYNIGNVNKVSAEYNDRGICIALTFSGSKGSKTVTKEEIKTIFSSAKDGTLITRNFEIKGAAEPEIPSLYTISKDNKGSVKLNDLVAENSIGEIVKIINSAVVSSAGNEKNTYAVKQSEVAGGNNITISGKGYGHGVGMSQYGAKGMAEAGFNYKDILKYYYTGVEVK